MTPQQAEAVRRLRAELGWTEEVATDQELLETAVGQRAVLGVHLDELRTTIRLELVQLAHRILDRLGVSR